MNPSAQRPPCSFPPKRCQHPNRGKRLHRYSPGRPGQVEGMWHPSVDRWRMTGPPSGVQASCSNRTPGKLVEIALEVVLEMYSKTIRTYELGRAWGGSWVLSCREPSVAGTSKPAISQPVRDKKSDMVASPRNSHIPKRKNGLQTRVL